MIALPDINVLLALAWSNHAHHEVAHRCFARDATAGWATYLLTQAGFLRLFQNPQVVGVSIDCHAAIHLLHRLVAYRIIAIQISHQRLRQPHSMN